MKIGLIIYGELNTISGGYLYDRMLARELQRQSNQVRVISLPWRNYGLHLLDNLNPTLETMILGLKLDVLLQDELNHPSLFALNHRLRRRAKVSIVSIVHHLRCHESHPRLLLPFYRAIEKNYLRTIDGFLVNSWTTRRAVESLTAHTDPGYTAPQSAPFMVAYPAGDHSPPPRRHVRQTIEAQTVTTPRLRLVFVGNVIPRKALHTVIESLIVLKRARPDVTASLQVVGSLAADLAYSSRVKALVTTGGLEDAVVFHDRVTDAALTHILAQGNVLTAPSFEGFGIVYLEAMRHGLCPIASTAGAAQEIVRHGENGFLVPPDDAQALTRQLIALADEPPRLHACRLAAHATYVQHPTWQDTFSTAHQWLREVTESN